MKEEIEQFMERGISPELFGPRIRNIPEIKSFRITSKKKSQQAEYDDFDFSGDTYETTDFDNGDVLKKNIEVADAFIDRISQISKREVSKTVKAFVWRNIDYRVINDEFISKYVISPNSGLNVNIPIYRDAIVYQNGAEPYERTMFGAYVLFPYANEDEYRTHNFFESIDKVREICAIDKSCELYRIQRNLKRNFLDNIMISDIAYGFRKKSDYFDFLECHKSFYGSSNYLRIDISDFFGTISRGLLEETFEYYVICSSKEEKEKIIESLLEILLYNGKLIQGTPLAPAVSNIIFRSIDIRIEKPLHGNRNGNIWNL